jgi:hypothetical protein
MPIPGILWISCDKVLIEVIGLARRRWMEGQTPMSRDTASYIVSSISRSTRDDSSPCMCSAVCTRPSRSVQYHQICPEQAKQSKHSTHLVRPKILSEAQIQQGLLRPLTPRYPVPSWSLQMYSLYSTTLACRALRRVAWRCDHWD